MADFERINIRPTFRTSELPCDGKVGDLLILSPLDENERDPEHLGSAAVWVCTKANWGPENENAVWQRIQFDGFAQCGNITPLPPQDQPNLIRG
jgi:hypothetical protein